MGNPHQMKAEHTGGKDKTVRIKYGFTTLLAFGKLERRVNESHENVERAELTSAF